MDYDLTNENIKDLKDLVLITTQIYDIYCDLVKIKKEKIFNLLKSIWNNFLITFNLGIIKQI